MIHFSCFQLKKQFFQGNSLCNWENLRFDVVKEGMLKTPHSSFLEIFNF